MSAHRRRRHPMDLTRRLAALPLALAALAGACSGTSGAAGVPEGFVDAGVDGVARVAHPKDWKAVDPSNDAVALQIEAPGAVTAGLPLAGVQILHDRLRAPVDIEELLQVQLIDLRGATRDLETAAVRDEEVEGADAAKLVEATFETVDGGVRVDAYYVFVLDGDRSVTLVVAGTDVDREVALRIVDTLRLES